MTGRRVRLFISDIDGCLSAPFEPYDLHKLRELRRKVVERRDDVTPAFTICTGRPLAYVESMVQAIGFFYPVLFEGGGGIYDPTDYTVRWAPGVTREHREQLSGLMEYWEMEFGNLPGVSFDYGKQTQASIVIRDAELLARVYDSSVRTIEDRYPLLTLADTHVSLDVYPGGLSKARGVEWLGREQGVAHEEMAFIGDSTGDIGAMQLVGVGIAPANAAPAVREAADYVCEASLIDAVHEGLDLCIDLNRKDIHAG